MTVLQRCILGEESNSFWPEMSGSSSGFLDRESMSACSLQMLLWWLSIASSKLSFAIISLALVPESCSCSSESDLADEWDLMCRIGHFEKCKNKISVGSNYPIHVVFSSVTSGCGGSLLGIGQLEDIEVSVVLTSASFSAEILARSPEKNLFAL